ncbi:hypothetical protein PV08_03797 [Exophiala spinifera]|uniref:Uncharacterized protein n=1 Tax=Exophiala spinifera TaxID=91928 RepID=A0A0D2BZ77_9EURO|nr:uncharacterized protein PV08_03797 [Exophiala spinifera]KIW16609.1 hypothetical protein PV08_03797 [Exophiala spinifera]
MMKVIFETIQVVLQKLPVAAKANPDGLTITRTQPSVFEDPQHINTSRSLKVAQDYNHFDKAEVNDMSKMTLGLLETSSARLSGLELFEVVLRSVADQIPPNDQSPPHA